ncbi:MAG TPA: ABC-F family ATP-binding cassette domain-containing protein [Candidatus Omnitrophota bacterium]|nr:ATP-binding cassette domain-containing protein [Candidatus Omnitrophota bacterium]HQO57249.1 ABC-F family ATP-binding cassette domain-containing protein [Candidatus Omnitrophota bacterium]
MSIFPQERIGLTGPNGAGKTTLFSIILGETESSGGAVQMQKNLKIGHLPQEARFHSDRTVLEEVTSGDMYIRQLLQEKHYYEETNKADQARYGDILEELEQLGIYEIEHKAEAVLSGLGFTVQDFHKPVVQLSGGWQMRTLLAKLLVYQYDVLLLDEPTNYLDLPATLWLKDFLKAYPGTFILISHDKVFLNEVTNYTIVLDGGTLTKVKGNYEAYEMQKEVNLRSLEKRQKVIEKRKQQLEHFAQRFHAQPNRAAAVKNKRKMIERLENIELPPEKKSIKDFAFPTVQSSGYSVIRCEHVGKDYGEKTVYRDLNFEILRKQKVCLVGPNGAGKSTLLKMLAGIFPPDRGKIMLGHQVQRGYFSQTRLDVLNPGRSVLDELASAAEGTYPATQMRTLLGLFNFHGEDVFKPVQVLSGGEKSRLILAKLLIRPPNFILLDEPTTHLDIDGVEALIKAFQQYEGTLCFISHDLFFVEQIADSIVEVSQGQIKSYPGGLGYYLDKKKAGETLIQKSEAKAHQETQAAQEEKKKAKGEEYTKLKEARRLHQQALKRMNEIKSQIKYLHQQMKDLEKESYVKSRLLSNAYGKDPDLIKECGQRLKQIPKILRELESEIKRLTEEKDHISK